MFTGIVQEVGRVKSLRPNAGNLSIEIEYHKIAVESEIGSSIAVNGACLTLISRNKDYFGVEAVKETLKYTNIGELRSGSFVNLEIAAKIKRSFARPSCSGACRLCRADFRDHAV